MRKSALLFAVLIAGCQKKATEAPRSTDLQTVATPPAGPPAQTSAVDMLTAFKAAYGVPAPAAIDVPQAGDADQSEPQEPQHLQFSPADLFQLSPGLFVLISKGIDPVGCHACGGMLAVNYLRRSENGFDLLSRSDPIGPAGSFGNPAAYVIRKDLLPNPVIQITSEDGGMGCANTTVGLYELAPSGLLALNGGGPGGFIDLAASRDGTEGDKPFSYTGKILPDVRAETDGQDASPHRVRSFKIVYSGAVNAVVPYTPEGLPLKIVTLPTC